MFRNVLLARVLLFSALILICLPSSARAVCNGPDGVAGDIVYNSDHHVLQYCNDTDWVGVGGSYSGGLSDGNKGDITVSGGGATWDIDAGTVGATELADAGVTYAKIQNLSGQNKILGRYSNGAGVVQELTFSTGLAVDGSGNITVSVVGLTDGDKGDITVSASGATWTIDNGAITYAKIQNVSAPNKILGRYSAGAGVVQELTLGSGLALDGSGNLTATASSLSGGTSGYLGVWSGATTLGLSSTTAGQQLFWDSTNHRLGIGGTAPADKLDVVGRIRAGATSKALILDDGTNAVFSSTASTNGVRLLVDQVATKGIVIDTAGNVGIGTASPAAKLDVNGTVRLAKNSSQPAVCNASPAVCNASNDASIALTAAYALCVCKNGTGWVKAADGNATCFWAPTIVNLTISSNTQDYNIFTAAGSPSTPAAVTLTINSGVTVGSTSTSTAALTTGSFPSGSTITIVNNGTIVGKGGVGGAGNYGDGVAGAPGGPAFQALFAVNITNNGTIGGGGGGGGGGNGATNSGYQWPGGGGGGGAGDSVGAAGAAGSGSCYGGCATAGNNGTATNGGTGGTGGAGWGGTGGTGGALGNAGASATSGPNGGVVGTPGPGGAAGSAVLGNAYISWDVTGTRLGPLN